MPRPDGYSALGRHPRVALPIVVLSFPLYMLAGMLTVLPEVYREWRGDLADCWRRASAR